MQVARRRTGEGECARRTRNDRQRSHRRQEPCILPASCSCSQGRWYHSASLHGWDRRGSAPLGLGWTSNANEAPSIRVKSGERRTGARRPRHPAIAPLTILWSEDVSIHSFRTKPLTSTASSPMHQTTAWLMGKPAKTRVATITSPSRTGTFNVHPGCVRTEEGPPGDVVHVGDVTASVEGIPGNGNVYAIPYYPRRRQCKLDHAH
ncbi:hypothetical protein BKA70DRAFT_68321 [Coprinopsis sp. MPI-PUGE-AT-0042]|nr:hypothetical protein BKA70DRAFT_68321 [Coprinopsis sp. MPI-PUGE-AT-0042]